MHRFQAVTLAVALTVAHVPPSAAPQATVAVASPVSLSEQVLNRLPADWRAAAARHIRATPSEQQRFLTVPEEVLRQTFARLLARARRR